MNDLFKDEMTNLAIDIIKKTIEEDRKLSENELGVIKLAVQMNKEKTNPLKSIMGEVSGFMPLITSLFGNK